MTISGLLSELSALAPYRASGRVRGCQGSLLVCEGLSSLVGLGETCHVEQPRYNQCEPPHPGEGPLAEVVAIDEARVHLLPFERLEAIGIGARVVVA